MAYIAYALQGISLALIFTAGGSFKRFFSLFYAQNEHFVLLVNAYEFLSFKNLVKGIFS